MTELTVNLRLEPSFDENAVDEVYITAKEPYLNFVMRLPKKMTKELGSGLYNLSLTPVVEKKKKAIE